jgi:uncharacterized protein (DUF39 family)
MYGKPVVTLFASSDTKDADFAVRLCDVYPDGSSMLLSDGIKRGRFINGYTTSDTASLIPGSIYEVEIELSQLAQVFMPGHRMRLIITGSNYPRYDVNLNNGGPMYVSGDSIVATRSITSSNVSPSKITFQGYILNQTSLVSENIEKRIYPNPSSGIVYFEGFLQNSEWFICDVSGKVISSFRIDEKSSYDCSYLSSGFYYFKEVNSGFVMKMVHLK